MAGCHDHRDYRAGCPCCQARARADQQRQRIRRRAGLHQPDVPADVVRDHIEALRAAGMALTVIAAEAGISHDNVKRIHRGERKHVRAVTADAILALTARSARRRDVIAAVGTARRIQALAAIGWGIAEQSARINTYPAVLWNFAHGRKRNISRGLAARVAALYDELYATEPDRTVAVKNALNGARRNGWLGPEAWTDDTIDDPDAQPLTAEVVDEVAVQRALAGQMPFRQLRQMERIEAYRRLVAEGAGPAAIRRRLNINGFTLMRLEALARQEQPGETCGAAA